VVENYQKPWAFHVFLLFSCFIIVVHGVSLFFMVLFYRTKPKLEGITTEEDPGTN